MIYYRDVKTNNIKKYCSVGTFIDEIELGMLNEIAKHQTYNLLDRHSVVHTIAKNNIETIVYEDLNENVLNFYNKEESIKLLKNIMEG